MEQPTTDPDTRIGAIVPQSLADELAALAALSDRSVAAEIRRALKAHVDAARNTEGTPA